MKPHALFQLLVVGGSLLGAAGCLSAEAAPRPGITNGKKAHHGDAGVADGGAEAPAKTGSGVKGW